MVRVVVALGFFSAAKICPTTLFDETKPQHGEGTFYDDAGIGKYPNNGNCGFCKLPEVLNQRWRVALSYADYGPDRPALGPHGRGGSAACGMCIKFRFPKSTVKERPSEWSDALVVDSCTGCKQGDVDFGVSGVRPPYDGRHPVEWYAVPCPGGSISYDFASHGGPSNNWYLRMGVRGMKVPLEQVEMCEFGEQSNECRPFYEETDGKWVLDFPALGKAFTSTSMKVRLTSIYGEQLDDVIGPIRRTGTNIAHDCASPTSTDEPLEGAKQFQNTKGTGVLIPADGTNGGGPHGCGTVPVSDPPPPNTPIVPDNTPIVPGNTPIVPGNTPIVPGNPGVPGNPDEPTGDPTPVTPSKEKSNLNAILIAVVCMALLLCCCLVFYCFRRHEQNSATNEQKQHAVTSRSTRNPAYRSNAAAHRSNSRSGSVRPPKKASERRRAR